MLWRKRVLNHNLQRLLELVLSNAFWTREWRHRHTDGKLAPSPTCTFCNSGADETQERLFWHCSHWAYIRQEFPLARRVRASTQHAVTKCCGLVLRSEENLHSKSNVIQMQTMMATVLQAYFAAGKMAAQQGGPENQTLLHRPEVRQRDLEIRVSAGGAEVYHCMRCGAFKSELTPSFTQEHCDGRPKTHRRFPHRNAQAPLPR